MVRSALITDVPWILELERVTFNMPRERIDYQDFIVDDLKRGYVDLKIIEDEGYIGNIAVKEEFRRNGIAGNLIEEVLKRAKSGGLSFVTLEVRESNIPAIMLYTKFGFEVNGVIKNHYFSPKENALVMTVRSF